MLSNLKALFSTPQRARLTISCLLVALATLGAIVYILLAPRDVPAVDGPAAPSETGSEGPVESDAPGQSPSLMGIVPTLTIDEARALALVDAGVAEGEADVSREALESDNGVWVYAFHFSTETAQYDYKINANTGEVRSMIKETFPDPGPGETEPSMPPLPAESTSPEESSAPEETDPQPSAEPQPTQSSSPEPSPSPSPSQPASMYIGADRARSIALDHAGLTASQVVITGTAMHRDGGHVVYQIKFRRGQTRYIYEIDAQTGAVLGHETSGD